MGTAVGTLSPSPQPHPISHPGRGAGAEAGARVAGSPGGVEIGANALECGKRIGEIIMSRLHWMWLAYLA